MLQFAILIITILIFQISPAYAQALANPVEIIPTDTDPRISSFNNPHVIWLPVSNARNQLLLFLQGTLGVPHPRFPFLATASRLGYHVIELSYPDDVAAQQACISSPDPDAYIKFRLAIIEGRNLSGSIHIDQADSIMNRVRQLLHYLDIHQPQQGWGQFLDGNGEIVWDKICVAGQSQGGGHAYVISKYHRVARVIMTGSPKDYSHYFDRPARGFDTYAKTPLDRYFTFNHAQDNIAGCSHLQQMEILQQMGLTQIGIADADYPAPSYNHAHILITNVQVGNMQPKQLHNAPLNGTLSVCPPVWQYMLTEPVQ